MSIIIKDNYKDIKIIMKDACRVNHCDLMKRPGCCRNAYITGFDQFEISHSDCKSKPKHEKVTFNYLSQQPVL